MALAILATQALATPTRPCRCCLPGRCCRWRRRCSRTALLAAGQSTTWRGAGCAAGLRRTMPRSPPSISARGGGWRSARSLGRIVPKLCWTRSAAKRSRSQEIWRSLHPSNGLGYQAELSYRAPFNQQARVAIGAIGYTRAELLEVLREFVPPTADSYRAQARLFTDAQAPDLAAFDALLEALATPPQPPEGARATSSSAPLRATTPPCDLLATHIISHSMVAAQRNC